MPQKTDDQSKSGREYISMPKAHKGYLDIVKEELRAAHPGQEPSYPDVIEHLFKSRIKDAEVLALEDFAAFKNTIIPRLVGLDKTAKDDNRRREEMSDLLDIFQDVVMHSYESAEDLVAAKTQLLMLRDTTRKNGKSGEKKHDK
jgi:hypothetical protein